MKTTGHEITLTIKDLAFGGNGVGRADGRVCFVPFTIPGDEVIARIVGVKKNYLECELVRVLSPSPDRQAPLCPLFGICGGCSLQHLSYPAQLKWKKNILIESLRRIGGIPDPPVADIIPSPREFGYRNRMRFTWIPGTGIGLYKRGTHEKVPVERCPILEESLNRLIPEVNSSLLSGHYSPDYPTRVHDDHIRMPDRIELTMDIDGNTNVRFLDDSKPSGRDAGRDGRQHKNPGKPAHRHQRSSADDSHRIDTEEFSQVNHDINSLMGKNVQHTVKQFPGAQVSAGSLVIDLFCGDGNFSLPLARDGYRILGLDISGSGIEKAETALRGMPGHCDSASRYKKADIYSVLANYRRDLEQADILIADPPRAGLGSIAAELAVCRVPRILYISCIPPILARDLRYLTNNGYNLLSILPFDMFPQTFHIESLAILSVF